MKAINDPKLINSETEPKTAEIEFTTPKVEPMIPEIVIGHHNVANPLENIGQMLRTTSAQIEKDMRETGFDGYIIVACPMVMICRK